MLFCICICEFWLIILGQMLIIEQGSVQVLPPLQSFCDSHLSSAGGCLCVWRVLRGAGRAITSLCEWELLQQHRLHVSQSSSGSSFLELTYVIFFAGLCGFPFLSIWIVALLAVPSSDGMGGLQPAKCPLHRSLPCRNWSCLAKDGSEGRDSRDTINTGPPRRDELALPCTLGRSASYNCVVYCSASSLPGTVLQGRAGCNDDDPISS